MTVLAFFGCNSRDSGHVIITPNQFYGINDMQCQKLGIPFARELDGSTLLLPKPERHNEGCLTRLPALYRTVIAWWGSPWDTRPGANNMIIAKGVEDDFETIWRQFELAFPLVASHFDKPTMRDH